MTTKKKSMGDMDRISALPDPVIHQIFSTMDMKEVVRTVLLSKRWKHLWKSTPFLNFHLDRCKSCRRIKRNALKDFIDRVLFVRDYTSIHNFTINSFELLDANSVFSWILALLNRGVREIHLQAFAFDRQLELPRRMELPHHLFTSEIRVITITTFCLHNNFYLKLPSSMCTAPKITTLDLCHVSLPEGNSKGELVIRCPLLKYLNLRDCDCGNLKQFTISAILLQSLCLLSVNEWRKNPSCKINILSPNLISLLCDGVINQDYGLGSLLSLFTADILVNWTLTVEDATKRLLNFFRGIQTVYSLTLRSSFCKALKNFPNQFEGFPNLKVLQVHAASVSALGLANLLAKSNRIESFIWDKSSGYYYDEEDWAFNSFETDFCCLKFVEIRQAQGNETELKILQFLLVKAEKLEYVTITTKTMQTEFAKKLSSLPRGSSIFCHPFH